MKKLIVISMIVLIFSGLVLADPGDDCLNSTESVNPIVEKI